MPRGGGLIIAAVCLFFYFIHTFFLYPNRFCWQYFVGALLIAIISWLDDLYTVPALCRLTVHIAAALLIVSVFVSQIEYGREGNGLSAVFAPVLVLVWVVWLTNAYNFMDGIDGIAGMQAVIAGAGWLAAGVFLNMPSTRFYGGVLAASALAFLVRNWQPAKIFMGDVGSAFLGYTFAAFPVLFFDDGKLSLDRLFLTAAAFLWLFLFDTIFTFCKRLSKWEKVWKPHRTHIYQLLVINGFSHASIAAIYGSAGALIGLAAVLALLKENYHGFVYATTAIASIFLLGFWKLNEHRRKAKN